MVREASGLEKTVTVFNNEQHLFDSNSAMDLSRSVDGILFETRENDIRGKRYAVVERSIYAVSRIMN